MLSLIVLFALAVLTSPIWIVAAVHLAVSYIKLDSREELTYTTRK